MCITVGCLACIKPLSKIKGEVGIGFYSSVHCRNSINILQMKGNWTESLFHKVKWEQGI